MGDERQFDTQPLPTKEERSRSVTESILTAVDDLMKEAGRGPVTRAEAIVKLSEMLKEREQLGIRKYGRSLSTWNGRDARRDALEEMVDWFQYEVQAAMEMDDLKAELAKVKAELEEAQGLLRHIRGW